MSGEHRVDPLEGWALGLVLLGHLVVAPWYPDLHSANELSRLYTAYALLQGDVEIGPFLARHGDVNDKSRVADSWFSDKPPGTALVALPALALRRVLGGPEDPAADLRLARLAVGVLPTFLLLFLLRREMATLEVPPPARALALATYGLGTLAFPYTVLFYGHQLVAVLVFAVTWLLIRPGPLSLPGAAAVGFLAALCLATEYQSAVYLLPLATFFLVRVRPLPSRVLMALTGALPPLVALGLYHEAAFGAPWRTGYSFVANPFFASVHAQGFMGVRWPRWIPFAGSLFGPSKGLLFFTPVAALGLLGVWAYVRRTPRPLAVLRVVQVALPIAFVSSMIYWDGGWTVGQRHLTPLMPLLVTPAALLAIRAPWAGALAPGLAVTSVMMTGTATLVFPHLPESFPNPFHDLVMPLAREGCLVPMALDLPGWLVVLVLGAGWLALALTTVLALVRKPWARALVLALLVLLPTGWVAGSSRLARLDPAQAQQDRAFLLDLCRQARRPPSPNPPGTVPRR